jgi:hypothetical protein
MHQACARALLSLILTGCLTQNLLAGPAIGVAITNGAFRIDGSAVKGNASLFDGSEVSTAAASSKLRIHGGTRLELATESQVRVFANRAVLEKGAGQVEGPPAYLLHARTLGIRTNASTSIARVRLDGADAVVVSAVNGPVRVFNASGAMLANLAAGHSLRFQPQGAAPDAVEATGCLLMKGGRFILVDQTTSQVFELRGGELRSEIGNRMTVKAKAVSGAQPMEGATQVIEVQSAFRSAPGGCLATASAVGADPPPGTASTKPGAAPAGTASSGPNKAIILGVVIAGAAGAGLALAMANSNKSK